MNQDSQPATNSPVTLINVFEVPTEHVDVFIARWRERAALMSTKPGFSDSWLHRALSSQNPVPARQRRPLGKPREVAGRHSRYQVPSAHQRGR